MRAMYLALLATLLTACSISNPSLKTPQAQPRPAPLFEHLGNFSRPISTQNAVAQRYFSQGLILGYGFNHQEAKRSLTIYHNRPLMKWNITRGFPDENADRTVQGYFSFREGGWWLENKTGSPMHIVRGAPVPDGESIEIKSDLQLRFSTPSGGRLLSFDFMRP